MFDAIDFKWNNEEKETIKTLSIKVVTSKYEIMKKSDWKQYFKNKVEE